jgi:hypothetical protein
MDYGDRYNRELSTRHGLASNYSPKFSSVYCRRLLAAKADTAAIEIDQNVKATVMAKRKQIPLMTFIFRA